MSRYEPVPLFVTTDSLLHNYHLFFNHLLKAIETDRLIPELKKLNQAMLLEAQKQYAALKDTAWENAAKRNMGFCRRRQAHGCQRNRATGGTRRGGSRTGLNCPT